MNIQIGMACRIEPLCSWVPWIFAALGIAAISILIIQICKSANKPSRSGRKQSKAAGRSESADKES